MDSANPCNVPLAHAGRVGSGGWIDWIAGPPGSRRQGAELAAARGCRARPPDRDRQRGEPDDRAGRGAAKGTRALRASLGATPGRYGPAALLTEAVVLAVTGGLLGTLLAFGQLTLLKRLLPADTPRLAEVAINERMLAFTAWRSRWEAACCLASFPLGGRVLSDLTSTEGSQSPTLNNGIANRRRTGDDRGSVRHHPAGGRKDSCCAVCGSCCCKWIRGFGWSPSSPLNSVRIVPLPRP